MIQSGINEFPLYCSLYDTKASILLTSGREQEAFAIWRYVEQRIPKCDFIYLHFAKALVNKNDMAAARLQIKMLFSIAPLSDSAKVASETLKDVVDSKR